MKHPAKIDIAVLILFFNRPKQLSEVFAEVRKARPSRLFLYQDGPRNEADLAGIEACRKVVADIDWECDVHQLYQERNYGCDPSQFISQRWAFSMVDKCIMLEDDDVPSQSFFPFCKEMLERYENDERITMVSGFNVDCISPDVESDYFFTSTCSIWGWASWRRVIDRWDDTYAFLDDKEALQRLTATPALRRYNRRFIDMSRRHRQTGKAFYETILWSDMMLHGGMAIMPKHNLINNIGLTTDSTHFSADLRTTPRAFRRIFTMPRHDIAFPLRHPQYVIDHLAYKDRLYLTHCWGHPWIKIGRSFEELWLNLRHGNLRRIAQAATARLRKMTRR